MSKMHPECAISVYKNQNCLGRGTLQALPHWVGENSLQTRSPDSILSRSPTFRNVDEPRHRL